MPSKQTDSLSKNDRIEVAGWEYIVTQVTPDTDHLVLDLVLPVDPVVQKRFDATIVLPKGLYINTL